MRIVIVVLALISTSLFAQTINSWTNSAGGNWEDAASWSLGIPPDSTQSVFITNAGSKTVVIDSNTVQTDAAAMTVSDITLDGTNELLLDGVGTNTALEVTNSLVVLSGTVVNSNSLLLIDGVLGVSSSGQFIQNGGVTLLTNTGIVPLGGGPYGCGAFVEGPNSTLLNGTFRADDGMIVMGQFTQSGGKMILSQLYPEGGTYSFLGGELDLQGLNILGLEGGGSFFQGGGTNYTANMYLTSPFDDFFAGYVMTKGALYTSNVTVELASFSQQNGVHIVTNSLNLLSAGYTVADGILSAQTLVLDGSDMRGYFTQSDSTTTISGPVFASGEAGFCDFSLPNGVFSCANFLNTGGAVNINQSGGSLIVSNLFDFGGFGYYADGRYTMEIIQHFANYNFTGGTLSASNIELDAQWSIGSGQSGCVLNPGYFQMSGTLIVSDVNESFGSFILSSSTITNYSSFSPVPMLVSNAMIDFAGASARLTFANSSGETWTTGALLTITNWSGLLSGGGNDQLYFGDDSTGLTTSQLSQIQFVNPVGLPAGTYPAKILNTGEIVPYTLEWLALNQRNNSPVFSWSPGAALQCASNVAGPYADLPGATSPYVITNIATGLSQQFFRLRH